jgi:YVTN family beta-propeller protein
VTVIDAKYDTVLTQIPAGNSPTAFYYDSVAGRVYCANYTSHDVTVIDAAGDSVIATVPVGFMPLAFAQSPAQGRLYVANYGGSSISVIRDVVAVAETMNDERGTMNRGPTVVQGVLDLGAYSKQHSAYRAELLDAVGRRVAVLRVGSNDVRWLAPGVYFVKEQSAFSSQHSGRSGVTKVIVAR